MKMTRPLLRLSRLDKQVIAQFINPASLPPPTPSAAAYPACYSNPASLTSLVFAYASTSATLCVSTGQSARGVLKARPREQSSHETGVGVYTAGTPASRCCAIPPG